VEERDLLQCQKRPPLCQEFGLYRMYCEAKIETKILRALPLLIRPGLYHCDMGLDLDITVHWPTYLALPLPAFATDFHFPCN
jgi:hypothetical protein